MEDLYYETLLAKNGDIVANEKILKKYHKYITYMINKYDIADKNSCYDEVERSILNAIQKIEI